MEDNKIARNYVYSYSFKDALFEFLNVLIWPVLFAVVYSIILVIDILNVSEWLYSGEGNQKNNQYYL